VDKFEEFDLTAVAGEKVQAPLVAECFANIECRVADSSLVAAYSLFLLEPVRAWTDPSRPQPQLFHHRGDGTFTLDGPTVDLKDRMTKWQYLL
jgi:flavin reductase (DIM6/NTAB) family NADH-FMN oxidoreductase RutF